MTHKEAEKYLKRSEKNGYVAYHSGLVTMDADWGINIDGDGHDGRLFGCPKIIWSAEEAEKLFPTKKYYRSTYKKAK